MNPRFARSEWFRRDRFGMFIHWGLYAIPARGEWVRSTERMPEDDYIQFFDTFDPVDYDPKAWARAAKQAGMRYAVLTAKHHDGFCLFDSKLTDWKATNTKAGRDLVREYVDAFRAEGIKVGLYYSLIDWHHPDYPAYADRIHPLRGVEAIKDQEAGKNFDTYLTYMHGQIRELCTNYGKLDLMWFDFSYDDMNGERWKAQQLMDMIHELQPDMLIDNRLEASGESMGSLRDETPLPWSGDFASPEQIIPPYGIRDKKGDPIPWEACITMNQNWGYRQGDTHFKDAGLVIRKLVECVSKGGNMLLNVGPDARGRIPRESLEVLRGIGEWMDLNGNSIYGCGYAEHDKPEWGRYTQNGKMLYAHVYEPPIGALPLMGINRDQVKKIRLLCDGSEVFISDSWVTNAYGDVTFADLSRVGYDCTLPDLVDTVLEIEMK